MGLLEPVIWYENADPAVADTERTLVIEGAVTVGGVMPPPFEPEETS